MGLNKDEQTIFYITEVFRLDSNVYKKVLSKSRKIREIFPVADEFTADRIKDIYLKKCCPSDNKHDKRESKNFSSYVRQLFKAEYLKLIGMPELIAPVVASSTSNPDESLYFQGQSDGSVTKVDGNQLSSLHSYCCSRLNDGYYIIWIDFSHPTGNSSPQEFFQKQCTMILDTSWESIENNINIPPCIIVLKNIKSADFKTIEQLIEKSSISNSTEIEVFLVQEDESASDLPENRDHFVHEDSSDSSVTSVHLPRKFFKSTQYRLFVYILIGVMLLICGYLLFQSNIFATNSTQNSRVLYLQLRYFSDETAEDKFYGGVHMLWLDESGEVILQENSEYRSELIVSNIPRKAAVLRISRGISEVYPQEIQMNDLTKDTIQFAVYRVIVPADNIKDSICRPASQRWYAFIIERKMRMFLRAIGVNGFSPQIAIYDNRLGDARGRLAKSGNQNGKVMKDSIDIVLKPGKYYLKVRGYDKSTGAFSISTSLL